jgi:dTDP-4-dehydrorhamnose reductase
VKLLVTGGAGYLGSEICRLAAERGHEVLATQMLSRPPYGQPVELDVRDADAVERVLLRHGPEAVIHTAYVFGGLGMRDTIVRGSRTVAMCASRVGARLVHLSTDLVFDGEQGAPYKEDSEPRPVMEYGALKLDAEALDGRAHAGAAIVRTSLLYGKPGPQERLAQREGIEFYTDEIRCPTRVEELAAALLELAGTSYAGTIHLAGSDAVSRYDFARTLRAAAGLTPNGIVAAPSPGPPGGRARNVALDSSKAAGLLETKLSGVGRSA